MDKIIEGIFTEIGAKIVGGIIALVLAFIGWEKHKRRKKVRQSQKAGKESIQIQINSSGEDVEQEQDAGDHSIQMQKEEKKDV